MPDNEQLANEIHIKIIDYILSSSLNISFIPDDIEREMYENIFEIVSLSLQTEKCKNWLKCGCCSKQKQ